MANSGLRESVYREKDVREKNMKQKSTKKDGIKEKSVKENGVKENSIKKDGVKKNSVKENSIKGNSIKGNSIKGNSIKEKAFGKKILGRKESRKSSLREQWKDILLGTGIIAVLAFFFYRSVWSLPFLLPVYILYQREAAKDRGQKRQKEISVQFKDAILAVSANQKAGYSVENSFKQSYEDMALLYGKDSIICRELYTIISGLGNNMVLEDMMYDFGKRSDVEEIMEFAQVFAAAKRNGGNLTEVIERSASVIEEKVETEKEIQVLVSAKRLEQKIMNIVPFGILLYISATSKGFFDVLYHNPAGIMIMTACLAVYIAAVLLSRKIVNIEV